MERTTITGTTTLFGQSAHTLSDGFATYEAGTVARMFLPGPVSALASAPVLQCLECGDTFSALDLYVDSPVDGECFECGTLALLEDRELISA